MQILLFAAAVSGSLLTWLREALDTLALILHIWFSAFGIFCLAFLPFLLAMAAFIVVEKLIREKKKRRVLTAAAVVLSLAVSPVLKHLLLTSAPLEEFAMSGEGGMYLLLMFTPVFSVLLYLLHLLLSLPLLLALGAVRLARRPDATKPEKVVFSVCGFALAVLAGALVWALLKAALL